MHDPILIWRDKIASLASPEEVEGFRKGLDWGGIRLRSDLEDLLRERHAALLRERIALLSKKKRS